MFSSAMVKRGTIDFASDFFGAVKEGLNEGAKSIGSEILPNWVSSQLNLQRVDQLNDSTLNPQVLAPRQDAFGDTTIQSPSRPAFFDTNKSLLSVSGGAVLLLAVSGAIVFMMLRRG